jgi:predicted unusual protein kinase regulating ubiquinone biosynthesis (AarF/ABC1/UbiB family)
VGHPADHRRGAGVLTSTRYARIVSFFARAIVSLLAWELVLPHVGLRRLVERSRAERLRRLAARFRVLAIRMGGVLIKVGQFLSSRADILPPEITRELSGLQDEVPPAPISEVRALAARELGAPPESVFVSFDDLPLAAASLGQAHRARLAAPEPQPGEGAQEARSVNVVVKIQRPGIEGLITTDLRALRTVGWWLNLLPFVRRRADVPALLAEFTRILFEEMDYLAEGRNAETFAVNFASRSDVRVPRVVWTRTTRRVLTLEDVFGTKLTDHEAIVAGGIDPKDVAARLFDAYLKQIFEDGFFHADPHPGNLFVSPDALGEGAQGWRLTFVDFGMVGRVSPSLRSGLRDTLIAVGLRDSARLVRAWQSIGVLRPGADLARLERAIGPVLDRFWGKSMEEIREMTSLEMGDLIHQLRGLVAEFPFQVPQDLVLLGRALGILSGMCSGLDPSFNAWPRIAPFARLLVAEDASRPWTTLLDELAQAGRSILAVPRRAEKVLAVVERGDLTIRVPDLTDQVARLEIAVRRLIGGIVASGLLVGGLQIEHAGYPRAAVGLLAGALIAAVWTAATTRRR